MRNSSCAAAPRASTWRRSSRTAASGSRRTPTRATPPLLIVRGLADLAQRLYSGQRPSDILAFDPEFFRKTGIHGALSATRANGFASLLRQIRLYAEAYARLEALGEAGK